MAQVILLGEMVKETRKVDERTALAINEILDEREQQDERIFKELKHENPNISREAAVKFITEIDTRWSGSDWNTFIDRQQEKATPNMADPETRKVFVKVAAIVLAALRVSQG
jgi:hypothetical protein